MNVMHVVRPAEGGMKNHVLSLLQHLDKTRYNLFLACPGAEEWGDILSASGVPVAYQPQKGRPVSGENSKPLPQEKPYSYHQVQSTGCPTAKLISQRELSKNHRECSSRLTVTGISRTNVFSAGQGQPVCSRVDSACQVDSDYSQEGSASQVNPAGDQDQYPDSPDLSESGATADAEPDRFGITTLELPLKGEISPLGDIRAIIRLAKWIRQHRIDILHLHGMKAGLVGRLAVLLLSLTYSGQHLPVVFQTVHNSVYSYPMPAMKKRFLALIQRFLARQTHLFITVSGALKQEIMIWEGVPEEKVRVVYNGIPVEKFQKGNSPFLKLHLGLNPDRPVVGTVARLAPQKGVASFIKAAAMVKQLVDGVQFLVVGEGPLKAELQREAKKLGLGEIMVFAGFYPDISQIYPLIDVFVVPSLSEGLSITTIEAMASRRPIVASYTGGIPELIRHRQSGLLVSPGDHQALAHSILEFLKRPLWAKSLAAEAQQSAQSLFSLEKMVAETEALYRTIQQTN